MARACCCDDYFTVDPDTGELCLKAGTMGLRQTLYYEPGTYTFRPGDYPWLARVVVEAQGGGGGSAGADAGQNECIVRPGGSGGAYARSMIEVSALGATVPLLVGAGGASGGSGSDGGDGGPSSFGGFVVAAGGIGGTSNMPSGVDPDASQGVGGPPDGTGDFTIGGGASGTCIRLTGTKAVSGAGGDSFLGKGGLARSSQGPGTGGRGRGGGAGGSLSFGSAVVGGVGGAGIVIVHLYG